MLLTAAERERLKKMAYGDKIEYRLRVRAQVVLHAARGRSNARIARETGLHLDTVRAWRGRFAAGGLPTLADCKRSGRPARFTPVQVAEAKALACQLPDETGVALACWSCPELAAELTASGISDTVSASTVRRWLREDALKPWQYRSWIFIRDPDFRAKAQRVRAAADRGRRAAFWALRAGLTEDAIACLEASRSLVLGVAAVSAGVADRLAAPGEGELAERWRSAASDRSWDRADDRSPLELVAAAGTGTDGLPDDLRQRSPLELLGAAGTGAPGLPGDLRRRSLDVLRGQAGADVQPVFASVGDPQPDRTISN